MNENVLKVLREVAKHDGEILHDEEYMHCTACTQSGLGAHYEHDTDCIVTIARQELLDIKDLPFITEECKYHGKRATKMIEFDNWDEYNKELELVWKYLKCL